MTSSHPRPPAASLRRDLAFIVALAASLGAHAHAQTVPSDPTPAQDTPAVPADATPAQDTPAVPADATPAQDTPAVPADATPAQDTLSPVPPPPPAQAAAAPADATLADDLLAAQVSDSVGKAVAADLAAQGPSLTFYGFADFTFAKHLTPFAFGSEYESFSVGNLNLYMSSELSRTWRSLIEVRYTYLPHGARVIAADSISRVDTTAVDYTDFGRTTRWGGITIERAWLEHTVHELLTVRAGSWLTPYGIWNVDHGSPVIIGVHRPWIVGEGLIPGRQTGIELYGSLYVDATQLGYHLTLSNGRGPVDAYEDFNHDKALGGRLYVRNDTLLGVISGGVSWYYGKFSQRREEGGVTADGSFVIRQPLVVEYDEFSLGADIKWEWGGLLLQSEAAMNEVAYTRDSARPIDPALAGGPPGYAADSRRHGAYVLAGYRTPFVNLMPFAGGEYYDVGAYPGLVNSRAFFGGLNMRVIAAVVLKAQYTHAGFTDDRPGTPRDRVNLVDMQAAWSF